MINSADFFDFGVDLELDLGVDFVDLVDFGVLLIFAPHFCCWIVVRILQNLAQNSHKGWHFNIL